MRKLWVTIWIFQNLEIQVSEMISCYASGDLQKLFFLKVLRYKNGMILIPKLNHLAGDGYSYFYFMSALAAFTKSSLFALNPALIAPAFKPNHNRTSLHDFALSEIKPPPVPPPKDMTVEDIEIPLQDVQSLSKEAASAGNVRISNNDILSAIATKKLVDVQSENWSEDVELTIPIDVRRQIKEFGPRFFGNSIVLHTTRFNKLRLVQSTLEEVAVQIRSSMPSISKEYYIDYLKRLESLISEKQWQLFLPFNPQKGCLVTNLSRLPTARLDFGTGPPDLIFPLTIEKNSAGVLRKDENYILRIVY